MRTNNRTFTLTLIVATLVTGAVSPVLAEQEQLMLKEVIVTAQKREQSLMKVPVAISAISGEQMHSGCKWLFNVVLDYTVPLQSGELYFLTDWNDRSESNIFLYESVEFIAEKRWLGGPLHLLTSTRFNGRQYL